VPFNKILNHMLENTEGSVAAVFADYEGETVALLTKELPVDDVKIIGAYQGIYLTQLRALCERVSAGEIERFKFDFPGGKILSIDLKDGYHVTLVVNHHANEGLAWRHLSTCRDMLLAEM
jgi:hypothetical protein